MFKIFKTIRGKLTLYFVTIFGLTLIAFCLVIYIIFTYQIENDVDDALKVLAVSCYETMKEEGIGKEINSEVKESYIPFSGSEDKFVDIKDSDGNEVFSSVSQIHDYLNLSKNEISDLTNSKNTFTTLSADGIQNRENIRIRIYIYQLNYNSQNFT